MNLAPGAVHAQAELTGFSRVERPLTVAADGRCAQTVNLSLALAPRQPLPATARAPQQARRAGRRAAGGTRTRRPGRLRDRAGAAAGRRRRRSSRRRRRARSGRRAPTRLLLPPGFSTDAPADAIAITGNNASIDRGMMNDRFERDRPRRVRSGDRRLRRGFRRSGRSGGRGGPGGFGGRGGRGGRGGPGGPRRPRRPGRTAADGRSRRPRRVLSSADAADSSSATTPPPTTPSADPRSTARRISCGPTRSPSKNPYSAQHVRRHVRRPGHHPGRLRRHAPHELHADLQRQPRQQPLRSVRDGADARRCAPATSRPSPCRSIDPLTRQPFAGNQIPAARIDPAAQALLRFIPLPNLPGTTRNFHNTGTDAVRARQPERARHAQLHAGGGRRARRRGGRGGGRGRRRAAAGGPADAADAARAQGTSVNMTAQLQYRRNDNDQRERPARRSAARVRASNIGVPVSLNIRHKRTMHAINVNFSSTSAKTTNHYAGVEDVAGLAGITGVSTDPFNWGVPSLSFSSLSSLRDVTPSRRSDRRLIAVATTGRCPYKTHQLRAGGDCPLRSHRPARPTRTPTGAFVFTGLYAAGGSPIVAERRPRLRRLPARPAAAGVGAVRPGQRAHDAASR